ncbi:retrotransposon protein, putative, ty1-copia subclass [Tanacetum coccineum]
MNKISHMVLVRDEHDTRLDGLSKHYYGRVIRLEPPPQQTSCLGRKKSTRGKVYNWETATYGKIWDNEEQLSCEPTVSSLNDNAIDFRISFDESDDEDYTVIYDKNSFSYKIISVNNLKTDSENDNEKVNTPSLPSPEPTVSCFDDLDFFKDFENEFPAIVYNDALTSKSVFLTEPTVSPQHIDEFNLKDETSLSEYDEEEQNVLYFNDLFSFNVIYPDDSKSGEDNDDDKIDIEHSSGDLSVKPLPDTDDGADAHGTVDTAYSLNKYSVFNIGINTAYPGVWGWGGRVPGVWIRFQLCAVLGSRERKCQKNVGEEFSNLEILKCGSEQSHVSIPSLRKVKKKQKGANGKDKGNNKLTYAPNILPPPKRDNLVKDSVCHYCKEMGHWRRSCTSYQAELKKRKNASVASTSGIFTRELYAFLNKTWVYDTGCGTHICNTSQGLRGSRMLKHGSLSMYMGNGMRAVVKAIGSFDLVLPSGLINVLDNYNVFYFNAIPHDGIYEINMHNLYPNVSSMFNVRNKRAKHALDYSYLWHCRLCHINKKRIDKLQRDGILQPTHDESLEKCKSCISGKMAPRILKMVPTKKVKRTPYEIWHGIAPKLSYLRVWGCETLVKRYMPDKLDPRFIKYVFVGYPKETMGYYFYYPLKNKSFVAQNAELFKNSLMVQESSGSHGLLESSGIDRGLELIQEEDTQPSKITSEVHNEVAAIKEYELGDLNEPPNCKAALSDPEFDKWLEAMNMEMQSMKDNQVWVLVDIPPNGRTVGSKWLFKKRLTWMDMVLVYGAKPEAELKVSCYADASFQTDKDDTKSQTRYVFVLNGGPVDWKNAKQSTTAMSSTEAEYIVVAEASMEAVWMRKFIDGLGNVVPSNKRPMEMLCDNEPAIVIANDPGILKGARHF